MPHNAGRLSRQKKGSNKPEASYTLPGKPDAQSDDEDIYDKLNFDAGLKGLTAILDESIAATAKGKPQPQKKKKQKRAAQPGEVCDSSTAQSSSRN